MILHRTLWIEWNVVTIINIFHPEILIYFFNSILNISATFHISVGALKY